MDRMLYIAMSGAKETMLSQATNTHNLANANTTGFRADLDAFSSLAVRGPGYDSRAYALTEDRGVNFDAGALIATGRDLDVAINGEGWIAVQAPDGSEAYTRAGDLRVDSAGLLTTGTGLAVLGNAGPIALPPFEKMDIGADGVISIRALGQAPNTVAEVDRIKLVKPPLEDLVKGDDGLLRTRDGEPQPAAAGIELVAGTLETSNVNSVQAMVKMIELARLFEVQVKLMKTAEDNDSASAQIMRMG